MYKSKLIALALIPLSIGFSSNSFAYQPIDTRMVDGIRIQSPSRVQAGKSFQVKLVSRRSKFKNGICWWNSYATKGFASAPTFAMSNGVAATKALPIEPGAATLSFICGSSRSNPEIGAEIQIYIAP